MRYAKTDQVLQLVTELQASHMGLTLEDIEDRFAVGRRTAQRMRDVARRLHPELLETIGEDRRRRWRIPAAASRFLSFTAGEIADLESAAGMLRRDGHPVRADSLKSIVAKVKSGLNDLQRRRMEPDLELLLEAEGLALRPRPRPVVSQEHLGLIRDAILRSHEISIAYRRRGTKRASRRQVQPYGFLFGNRLYLVARSPELNPDMRLYDLARIGAPEIAGKTFVRDSGFSMPAFAERSFGVFQEEPVDVVWRFSPKAAPGAREYLFHPTQTMENQPDGSLIVRFKAGGLVEMSWHAYTWGRELEVLAPPRLAELCRNGTTLPPMEAPAT